LRSLSRASRAAAIASSATRPLYLIDQDSGGGVVSMRVIRSRRLTPD